VNVGIVGTGLIGGSIGLALKASGDVTVTAYDRDSAAAAAALRRQAADRLAETPAEAARDADVVFVATPVGSIVEAIQSCLSHAKEGAIISDVGSVKARVVLEVEKITDAFPGITFVGGHPMAGSESEGIEAARPDLFHDAWWVLTPGERVDPAAYRRLHRLLTAMGARVMALEAHQHDDLMAVISHIPQLAATALMNQADAKSSEHGGLLSLAAGGFKDVTRIAGSNPDLWVEICLENAEAISNQLEDFIKSLLSLNQTLKDRRPTDLRAALASARNARRRMARKMVASRLFELSFDIPDRPGVLAHVTRLVGDLGVNIEDLTIEHATEGGRGSLHLVIGGEDEALKVQRALSQQGYITKATEI